MKILILTCATGEGHNSAGKAIMEQAQKHGDACEMVNAFQFLPKGEAKIVTKSHSFIAANIPKIFGAGSKAAESVSQRVIYTLCAQGASKIYKFLQLGGYDIIICVHAISALMITHAKKKFRIPQPVCFVATDYSVVPGVSEMNMDAYFIPVGFKDKFVSFGVPERLICETGIPVGERFYIKREKYEAREALGLPDDKRIAMLMCGSLGCRSMISIARRFSEISSDDQMLVIICGNNKRVKNRLEEENLRNTMVIGYTTEVDMYMDAVDLLISKAGGLTSTEALSKRLPTLCVNIIPYLESQNQDYMVDRGFAFGVDKADKAAAAACELLGNDEKLSEIRLNIESGFIENSAAYLYRCLSALLKPVSENLR